MPFYKIRPGYSFNLGNRIAVAGEVIELGADIAAVHSSKIDFAGMTDPAASDVQTSAQPEQPAPAATTAAVDEAPQAAGPAGDDVHQVG